MTSQAAANFLLAALVSGGVERFFIAPGSRSQALAIAAAKLEEQGRAQAHIRLDERALAFTALGAARASGKPVAVIVTSGTAVANLLPAVLEAKHSSTPLILLTADRPARLHGRGANQTLDSQAGIFGYAANAINIGLNPSEQELLAAATAAVHANRPTQLNIELDLPLSDGSLEIPVVERIEPSHDLASETLEVAVGEGTVVVAGAGGAAAAEFAQRANLPLIAEPSSGARSVSQAVSFPELALEQNHSDISQVIVFGKPTLSRAVQSLISTAKVFTATAGGYGGFDPYQNVLGSAHRVIPKGVGSDAWLERFRVSRELSSKEEFVSYIWDHSDRLVLGASDLIRRLDQVAAPRELEVYSNRGLSGIDGTVSTALGIALVGGETTALIGDLTLLHDASGLNLSDLGNLPVRIVVGNDMGGQIFSRLEVAEEISPEVLSRFFLTPQQVDLAALAAAYGWEYRRCNSLPQLEQAWPITAPTLIDYRL